MLRQIIFAVIALLAAPVAAKPPCDSGGCDLWQGANDEARADDLMRSAWQFEQGGEPDKASYLYGLAAAASPTYRPLALYRRFRAQLDAGATPSATLVKLVAQGPAYPQRDLNLLRAAGDLPEDLSKSALVGPNREAACEYLGDHDLSPALLDLYYGYCTLADLSNWRSSHVPSSSARLARGWRMYKDVRFRAADAEIKAIALANEPLAFQCDVKFLTGRTVNRLRRRDDSEAAYRWVRDRCASMADLHIRSLYAIGKRRFEKNDLAASRLAFEAIANSYPNRSHADDAWFYLARIARKDGDRAAELAALRKVLTDYRTGDMLFEMVWEVYEGLYRSGNYQAFLNAINDLDLPEQDEQYYSQGRLAYFRARSARKLGDDAAANRFLTDAWVRYPFSYYGYLSWVRLKNLGLSPPEIQYAESGPAWLESSALRQTTTSRLLRAQAMDLAVDATTDLGTSDAEQWWRALAFHRHGLFHVSHNIVRRKIANRPWHDPRKYRMTASALQWEIAWPNPFGSWVESAVEAEAAQFGARVVAPALPTAIMREESSFIEDIESYAGAIGLMQLMPRTALAHDNDVAGEATVERLKTAEVNVRVGVDHIFWLAKRFNGHPALVVAAYNAGGGAVNKWLKRQPNDDIALFVEDIPYLQTRNYTKRVIGSYAAYQWLSGRTDLDRRVAHPAKKTGRQKK